MKTLELNKIFAAILTAGVAFMLTGVIGRTLVRGERPHDPAISFAAPAAPTPAVAAAPALEPISGLLASADVEAGKGIVQKQCAICHSVNEGGKNGVGPNIYGIVGAPHAHAAGFNYSDAIKAKTGPWNYEELNAWLAKPAAYAPGTRMGYAGLPKTQDRANVVAYLRTLAATPVALPAAGAAVAAPAAAPAAAAAAPGAAIFADLAPVGPLLAAADLENGKVQFTRNCGICHTPTEGGRNGVGPNLWGVVGRHHAAVEGFNYSAANKALAGTEWDFEELNKWLYKPTVYMPGTRMVFAGLPDAKVRADVIAFLRTLSSDPKPLP